MLKSVEEMTPAELRALAEQKEWEESEKVIKRGTLKCDLYCIDERHICSLVNDHFEDCFVSKEEIDDLLKKLETVLTEIKISAKSSFSCFNPPHGRGSWYDDVNFGIEDKSDNWAEKYLENIEQLG